MKSCMQGFHGNPFVFDLVLLGKAKPKPSTRKTTYLKTGIRKTAWNHGMPLGHLPRKGIKHDAYRMLIRKRLEMGTYMGGADTPARITEIQVTVTRMAGK